DIMTELLTVEFEDETGTMRRLRRDELLIYVNVLAQAGNETTTRLIGWMGKVLAENPGQRRAWSTIRLSSLRPSRSCCATNRLLPKPHGMSPETSSTTVKPCPKAAS